MLQWPNSYINPQTVSLVKDTYGRTINYLRLSVTDRCNLRCGYCMPEEGVAALRHEEVLTYEELLAVATAAVSLGVSKIRVTGGEPLVRRGIVDFIARLAALPGSPEIVLTTNGLLLAEQAPALKAAGLARVNVSLDTLRSERFLAITRREGLEQVLAGIEAAEKAGLVPLKINVVPLLGVNSDEIADFARLTLAHPWEIRFIEYMPVSSGLAYSPERRMPAPAIYAELGRVGPLVPLNRDHDNGPAQLFRYPDSHGRIGLIPAVSSHFCDECNRLRVTADGRVRPCLLSDQEIDLRQHLRSGASVETVATILAEAILGKPAGHRIGADDFVPGRRRMHGIGG